MNRTNYLKIVHIVTKKKKRGTHNNGKNRNCQTKHGIIITLHFTDMRLILQNILSSLVYGIVVTSREKRVKRTWFNNKESRLGTNLKKSVLQVPPKSIENYLKKKKL